MSARPCPERGKGSGSRKLTGSPRKDHNQTKVCRVACAQAGLCPKRGEGSGSRKLMGSPGGITTRHEFAELACTDRHREAGSRLRVHRQDSVPSEARVPGYTEAHGFTPEGSRPGKSLQSRVCTDRHDARIKFKQSGFHRAPKGHSRSAAREFPLGVIPDTADYPWFMRTAREAPSSKSGL